MLRKGERILPLLKPEIRKPRPTDIARKKARKTKARGFTVKRFFLRLLLEVLEERYPEEDVLLKTSSRSCVLLREGWVLYEEEDLVEELLLEELLEEGLEDEGLEDELLEDEEEDLLTWELLPLLLTELPDLELPGLEFPGLFVVISVLLLNF